jgi:hypothetical protein
MGQPVVHFEVIGTDGEKLRRYYSELMGPDKVPEVDIEIALFTDPRVT